MGKPLSSFTVIESFTFSRGKYFSLSATTLMFNCLCAFTKQSRSARAIPLESKRVSWVTPTGKSAVGMASVVLPGNTGSAVAYTILPRTCATKANSSVSVLNTRS